MSRFVSAADRSLAATVFQANKPILDSELNLIAFAELEARAETVRSALASGWLMDESNTRADYFTDPSYSNLFFFGRQTAGELRNLPWAVVNGWLIPVAGTQTGAPPLSPNDAVTWNRVELSPPNTSTGGNRAEFVFLEVWMQRIDVDPPPPAVAPGKPQRGFLYRFGNVESGFSYLPDELIDPELNFETTKRVQIQYRIRVVPDVNMAQYPEGFDPTLVLARGGLTSASALPFENMREKLGDPGLWRAGSGDPATFGTVDGYVYAVPISSVFRRNAAGFSDTGNLAGAFNRNSLAINRDGATVFTSGIVLPADITDSDVTFTLTSVAGTVLETITSYGEAYFRIDDEIVRVNNVTQVGPTAFDVTLDRGQLQTIIRSHLSGAAVEIYTVRPDGLYADQVAQTDVLDLRHSVADKFDYGSILKTNLLELMKGNLRTAWKRFGSTNSAGPVVFYGDRITDGSIFTGGLSRLDAPNGNRRAFSDAVVTERYNVGVQVPLNSSALTDSLQVAVNPYTVSATWEASAPSFPPGSRLDGSVSKWYNSDKIRIAISDFQVGLPVGDADQVRFVLPSEDADAVLIRFEGMTTDPNGGEPTAQPFETAPSATNTVFALAGERILKDGQGITVTLDAGDLVIELASGTADTLFDEFEDAVTTADQAFASKVLMHVSFAVVYGAGRGLSHKPDYIHTVHWRGNPTNSSKVLVRPGLSDKNRMVPTYLSDSPMVQTGKNRDLARTSGVMVDPGSKTVWVAPYRNTLVPELLVRDGSEMNWTDAATFQGSMPTLTPDGTATAHATVDPLSLFFVGVQTRYAEVSMDFLPRPGLHHTPIVPATNATFPSGVNFMMMSKEGPFGATSSSDHNRNLVSYPSTAGYYIVTPVTGETYGTGSGSFSAFGRKYENPKVKAAGGGPFRGIQFPHFYGPARITGVYVRDTTGGGPFPVVPASSPFNTDRVFVGGVGAEVNLLRDDFDGPTYLLDVDTNGDLTFVLNADALDLTKAAPGTTFDNAEFLVECTLFGFDRGFLQTNGRILGARTSSGGSLETAIDTFTDTSDDRIGIIVPAPMSLASANNELTVYYSRQPYQGDVFGSQNAYSDDAYRLGPLTVSEATALFSNKLAPVSELALENKAGYEVLTALNFTTSLGTGRLSGSVPIPLLTLAQDPDGVEDYAGTWVDLNRKFSPNRTGYEDWAATRFPVLEASIASRPPVSRGAMSEVFDRDANPEFAGSIAHLPMGAYFRDKDFLGKTLYQTRSSSNIATNAIGTMAFPPYQAPTNPTGPGQSSWEGTEFVCGQASGTSGVGGEAIVKVDGTSTSFSDVSKFKTARGGAGWSQSGPWAGGPIASRMQKARPNSEVGSIMAGTAYLVRSQPESLSSVEVHHGQELQMIIVTRGVPAYFRDTDVLHSASGTNEGFTALDRFRIWGRPLEKRRGEVDVASAVPGEPPLFVNEIFDDPVFFGSSDINLTSAEQEVLPVTVDGQTAFTLTKRPLETVTVQAYARGVKLTYGVDYTVAGATDQDLTYIVHAANPALLTTDTLEAWYIEL